jgi:rhodanese-related sulfurtransferase
LWQLLLGAGDSLAGRLLLLDGLRGAARVARLRGPRPDCPCAVPERAIFAPVEDEESCPVQQLDAAFEMSAAECAALLRAPCSPLLVDVRSPAQFSLCALPGSVALPLAALDEGALRALPRAAVLLFVCRRGLDSLAAARRAAAALPGTRCLSMRGGLQAWALAVDSAFPVY